MPKTWGTLVSALRAAGVVTGSARKFWGAMNADDDIVSTAWIDSGEAPNQLRILRPPTNHGGLKDAWDVGRIEPGATLRVVLIRQRGDAPWGKGERKMKDAALLPGRWKVIEVRDHEVHRKEAVIEQV
jgi:hypothetical protein